MGFMLDGLLSRKASVVLQPAQHTQTQTYAHSQVSRPESGYPFQADYDPYGGKYVERPAQQSRYVSSHPTDFFPPYAPSQQHQMRYEGPSPDMSPRGAAFARSQSLSSQVAPHVVTKADPHATCTCAGHGSHNSQTWSRPGLPRSRSDAGFNMSQMSYELARTTSEPEDLLENTNMVRGNSSFSSASSSPYSSRNDSGRSRSTSPPTSTENSRNVSRKGSRADMTKPLEQIPEVPSAAVPPLTIRKEHEQPQYVARSAYQAPPEKASHWNAGFGWDVRKEDHSYAPSYQPPNYGQSMHNDTRQYESNEYRSKAPSVSTGSTRKPSVFASSGVPMDTVPAAYAQSVAGSTRKPSVVASSSVPMDTIPAAYAQSVAGSTRRPSVVASSSVPMDTIPAAYRSRSDSRKPSVVASSSVPFDTIPPAYAQSVASSHRNPSIVAPSGMPLDAAYAQSIAPSQRNPSIVAPSGVPLDAAYAHSAMMERRPSDQSDSSGSGYGYSYGQRAGSIMTTSSRGRNGSTVMYNGRKGSVSAGSVAYNGRKASVGDKEKGSKQRRPSDWGSAMASFA